MPHWWRLVCTGLQQARAKRARCCGGGRTCPGKPRLLPKPPWSLEGALKAGGAEGGTTTTGRTLLAPPPDRGPRRARGLRERVRGSPWPGSGCRAGRPPRCAAGRGNRSHRPPGCTGSSPAWRRAGGQPPQAAAPPGIPAGSARPRRASGRSGAGARVPGCRYPSPAAF